MPNQGTLCAADTASMPDTRYQQNRCLPGPRIKAQTRRNPNARSYRQQDRQGQEICLPAQKSTPTKGPQTAPNGPQKISRLYYRQGYQGPQTAILPPSCPSYTSGSATNSRHRSPPESETWHDPCYVWHAKQGPK